ncbi:MAG: hypothetical protein KH135_04485 [Firmicutes bacterium]|nr:hypothetical protein [Bacillota bacterium]
MLTELLILLKDFVLLLWWGVIGSCLLWFISHMLMMSYKTLFCDVHVKLYKVWKKQLKQYTSNVELENKLKENKQKPVR